MRKSILVTILILISFGIFLAMAAAISPEILDDDVLLISIFLVFGASLFLVFRHQINQEVEKQNLKQTSGFPMYQKVSKVQMIILLAIGITIIVYKLIIKYIS